MNQYTSFFDTTEYDPYLGVFLLQPSQPVYSVLSVDVTSQAGEFEPGIDNEVYLTHLESGNW